MNVIGVDWSLSATGVCNELGALRTLTPPTKDNVARLEWMFRQAQALVAGDVDILSTVLVFESPFMGMKGKADATMALGEMYGVVKLALRKWAGRIVWVAPSTLKVYATGRGNATKPDMRAELIKRAGVDIKDDNQCDAWWLRAMALDRLATAPLELPATHRRALASVTWPGAG